MSDPSHDPRPASEPEFTSESESVPKSETASESESTPAPASVRMIRNSAATEEHRDCVATVSECFRIGFAYELGIIRDAVEGWRYLAAVKAVFAAQERRLEIVERPKIEETGKGRHTSCPRKRTVLLCVPCSARERGRLEMSRINGKKNGGHWLPSFEPIGASGTPIELFLTAIRDIHPETLVRLVAFMLMGGDHESREPPAILGQQRQDERSESTAVQLDWMASAYEHEIEL